MRPKELILRCYAERKHGQWQAFCLDFSLAAQGDSFDEARAKLDRQIHEYVHDALMGEDRPHAPAMLARTAPLRFWLRYFYIAVALWVGRAVRGRESLRKARFNEAMPLVPSIC